MGLTAIDVPFETSALTGVYGDSAWNAAIHLVLDEEELIQRYDLFRGTGGSVAVFRNTSVTGLRVTVEETDRRGFLSAAEKIKNVFNLTDNEFCDAAKISSRRTLYNWRNDDTKKPRTETLRRIFSLLAVAESWSSSGFSYKKEQLHSKAVEGESLFDALTKEELDEELILFIGSTLTMSAEAPTIRDPFA